MICRRPCLSESQNHRSSISLGQQHSRKAMVSHPSSQSYPRTNIYFPSRARMPSVISHSPRSGAVTYGFVAPSVRDGLSESAVGSDVSYYVVQDARCVRPLPVLSRIGVSWYEPTDNNDASLGSYAHIFFVSIGVSVGTVRRRRIVRRRH